MSSPKVPEARQPASSRFGARGPTAACFLRLWANSSELARAAGPWVMGGIGWEGTSPHV